jgi:hypothetical protein
MNRYEFEDKISDYLDNQLSVPERKAFEDYCNSNNEAKELVESIRKTLRLIESPEPIKASSDFLPSLISRINSEKKNISNQSKQKENKYHFFGLTPVNATLMAAMLVCFISISVNLIPSDSSNFQSDIASNKSIDVPTNKPSIPDENFASTFSDTSDTTSTPKRKIKLNDKIKFVKNPR